METARHLASRLLEAGPDDLNPRAELGRLKRKPWLVAFELPPDAHDAMATSTEGMSPEIIVPVLAMGNADAASAASTALTQRGHREHILVAAWPEKDQAMFDDLVQLWGDTGLEEYRPE